MPLRKVEEPKTVGLSSHSSQTMDIRGFAEGEVELMQGCLNGSKWVRIVDGRVVARDAYKGFPDPVTDREMQPFWTSSVEASDGVQMELFHTRDSFETKSYHQSCSIYISSLCGYNYSKENYETQANLLLSYGFDQMRSRRGENGKYWEVWYLPGLWCAEGDLKAFVDRRPDAHTKIRSQMAINFLRRNVQFGSMNITFQRLAMVLD